MLPELTGRLLKFYANKPMHLFFAVWMAFCGPMFFGGAAAHPMKMSVCEVVYQPASRVFLVKCYLFQDDLRETLYNDPYKGTLDQGHVEPYLKQHVLVRFDQAAQNLQFQGIQTKNEQILVTFTVPMPTVGVQSIAVNNTLLVGKFSNQTNMVYLYYPNEQNRQVRMCNVQQTAATFSL